LDNNYILITSYTLVKV